MTNEQITKAISEVSGVRSVRGSYINLVGVSSNGDRNARVSLIGKTVRYVSGKGYTTDGFSAAVDALRAWCAEHGTVNQPYSDCADWTAEIA